MVGSGPPITIAVKAEMSLVAAWYSKPEPTAAAAKKSGLVEAKITDMAAPALSPPTKTLVLSILQTY